MYPATSTNSTNYNLYVTVVNWTPTSVIFTPSPYSLYPHQYTLPYYPQAPSLQLNHDPYPGNAPIDAPPPCTPGSYQLTNQSTRSIPRNPSHDPNPQIQLERNSLYITTVPVSLPGTAANHFHWALIHVDASGSVFRHHFAALSNTDLYGLEGYQKQQLLNGARARTGPGRTNCGYFKVNLHASLLSDDSEFMKKFCQDAFPRVYGTASANRQYGLSCRTWVLRVVEDLIRVHMKQVTSSSTSGRDALEQGVARQIAIIETFVREQSIEQARRQGHPDPSGYVPPVTIAIPHL